MWSGMTGICFEDMYFPNAMIAHADAALGALKCFDRGKVGFINCAIDISPECDCFPWSGLAVAPDVGIFAGKDLLAVEEATLDAIDNAPIGPGSVAEEKGAKPGDDKYKLNEYEPVLNPENAAKWQIRKGGVGNHRPTTVRLRDVFYKHDLATEVMPFRRIKYDKEWVWNEWKKYDPFKGEMLG